jgi:hypothetical protein
VKPLSPKHCASGGIARRLSQETEMSRNNHEKAPTAPMPMAAAAFRHAIDTLGWRQQDVADFLRCGLRTVRRYASGEVPVPFSDGLLMRLLIIGKVGIKVPDGRRITLIAKGR